MHIHKGHFLSEFPLINGHEFAGEIVETGKDVENVKIGEKVVADNTELCGHCFFCKRDEPLFCENFISHGCNVAGGFAEYAAIKSKKIFPIKNLSYKEAVMVEPTACAMHGMDVIRIKPGSEVLLFGAGPTGLILAQLAKLNGAANLVVAAPAGEKLELAKELAADEIVPIDKADYSKHKKFLLEKYPLGFDTVIEATGVPYNIVIEMNEPDILSMTLYAQSLWDSTTSLISHIEAPTSVNSISWTLPSEGSYLIYGFVTNAGGDDIDIEPVQVSIVETGSSSAENPFEYLSETEAIEEDAEVLEDSIE